MLSKNLERFCLLLTKFLLYANCITGKQLFLFSFYLFIDQVVINPVCSPDFRWASNNSCIANCDPPLHSQTSGGEVICSSPCPAGNYLHYNGVCLPSCPPPLISRIDPGIRYCLLPCSPPNTYLLPNGDCSANCSSPAVAGGSAIIPLCTSPCDDSEYFYEQENECRTSCDPPYESQQISFIKVCKLGVNNNPREAPKVSNMEEIKGLFDANSALGQISGIGMKTTSVLNSNSPSFITLAGVSSMLLYFRYMKIRYPPNLLGYFRMQDYPLISIGFGIDFPLSLEENIESQRLPDVFEFYKLHSSFLVNSWNSLTTLVIVFVTIFIIMGLLFLINKSSKVHALLGKLLQQAKWNYPLMILCGSFGETVFYSALQFRTSQFDSLESVLGLFLAIGMVAVSLWIVCQALFIVIAVRKNQKKIRGENVKKQEDSHEKWKDYGILYSEYKENSFLNQSYMTIYLLRNSFFHLIIVTLFNYPLLQAILLTILSVVALTYLLLLRPLKNLLDLIQTCINEVFLLIVTAGVLILAISNDSKDSSIDLRERIGDTIIIINTIFCSLPLAFLGISGLSLILRFYKASKGSKKISGQTQVSKTSAHTEKIQTQKKKANRNSKNKEYWSKDQNERDTSSANFAKESQFDSFIEIPTFNEANSTMSNHQLMRVSPERFMKFQNHLRDNTKNQKEAMNSEFSSFQTRKNTVKKPHHPKVIKNLSKGIRANPRQSQKTVHKIEDNRNLQDLENYCRTRTIQHGNLPRMGNVSIYKRGNL